MKQLIHGNPLDGPPSFVSSLRHESTMKTARRVFLRQVGMGLAGVWMVGREIPCPARPLFGGQGLPRCTPEDAGISSEGIVAFLAAIAKSRHEFHSVMILRHGHVVAEGWWSPYGPRLNHMLYSLSKSFTSTAVGLALSDKKLSVDDAVVSFFPEDLPSRMSENLRALRVKHLLSMSVGHAEDSTGRINRTEDWVKSFLALPIENPPGTKFLYNSGATYMLSAIVQKVTGQRVLEFLKPRLFAPLDIKGVTWETCPRGINTGGWGLSVPTEALAKFGQLYLDHGAWKGRVLIPPAWVKEATTFKIQQGSPDMERAKRESDWHQGYCYQFWRCRHNAFRGDGAFGQFMVVMPEQDAAVAITCETSDMQGELNLVWEHLLPAMKEGALPANHEAHMQLRRELASLALEPTKASPNSPVCKTITGKRFAVETNSMNIGAVAFEFRPASCVFKASDARGTHLVTCGLEQWIKGETSMPGTPPKLTMGELGPISKVAGSGTWKDDNTFEMTWRFYETPHHDTVTCHFEEDKVRVEFMNSLTRMSASHKETRPVLEGRLV